MFTEELNDDNRCPICGAEQVWHTPAGNGAPRFKCPNCHTWLHQQLSLNLETEWAKGQTWRTFAGYLYPHRYLTDEQHRLSQFYLSLLRGGIAPQMIAAQYRKTSGDILATLDWFVDNLTEVYRKNAHLWGWTDEYAQRRAENGLPIIRDYQKRVHELAS